METTITRDDAAAHQAIAFGHKHSLPPICQLPIELIIGIFQLALPEIPFVSGYPYIYSRSYIRTLYLIRSVTRRWRGIIDGVPSFWTTIDSTFPPHINEASILRSSNLPLSIIYRHPQLPHEIQNPSATEFLKTIAHTRPRWSTVALDLYHPATISDYLGAPLPLLQTVAVRDLTYTDQSAAPVELLGGNTTNLRFVVLSGVSIHWRMGSFVRLKHLSLGHNAGDGMKGSYLLNVLDASPGLQVLKLKGISTTTPPPSPITTLHHLKYIKLYYCDIELVEWICHQIRAPSCTRLVLSMDEEQVFDIPHFLSETLKPFHDILRTIHKRLGKSDIRLDSDGIQWVVSDYARDKQGLSIFFDGFFDPFFIHWVSQILQNEPGLQIIFADGATSSKAVLESLAPLRNVTRVTIRDGWHGVDVSAALRFLGEPPSTTASLPLLPSLPCLREVKISSLHWEIQDVLNMVQSRFRELSSEGMEEPLLSIKVDRGGSHVFGITRPIIDLATLVKTREASGVKCVQLGGWKDPKGMLAVAWNEEASKPVWV